MLKHRKMIPLDYSLCCMTVTVEDRNGGSRVLEGVHFEYTDTREVAGGKAAAERNFLLVIPGEDPVAPGDRVIFNGRPSVAANVKPRYFQGRLCHTEVRG